MGNIWLTSDLHIGHKLVANERGFDSISEHDEYVFNSLSQAEPEDDIWILGDLAVGKKQNEIALRMLNSLAEQRINLHLIPGNHDPCHPMHSHSWKSLPDYSMFKTVQPFVSWRVMKRKVWFSHFPFAGDHSEQDRYKSVRLQQTSNDWIVHGHTHSKEKYSDNQVHAGLDAWDLQMVNWSNISNHIQKEIMTGENSGRST